MVDLTGSRLHFFLPEHVSQSAVQDYVTRNTKASAAAYFQLKTKLVAPLPGSVLGIVMVDDMVVVVVDDMVVVVVDDMVVVEP